MEETKKSSNENLLIDRLTLNNLVILIILIILGGISFLIIKNFIIPIIFTGVLVYVFQPIYHRIHKIVKYDFLASSISIILIISVILIPTIFTFTQLYKEFASLENGNIISSMITLSKDISRRYGINIDIKKVYDQSMDLILEKLRFVLYDGIPKFLFNVFIFIFFFYYFLKNSVTERDYFNKLFKKNGRSRWNYRFKELIYGIIYGQVFVKLIQASLAIILFFIVGVENAVLWGVLIFFAAFIPIIGTSIIWLPLVFINISHKEYHLAVIIFFIGLFISFIDNLLAPHILSDKMKVGPVLTVISIFGGLQIFGLYGLILGPFFIGLFILFLEEFLRRLKSFEELNSKKDRVFIWTKEEREKVKRFKTKIGKEEYIRMINKKYERRYQYNNKEN